MQYCEYFYNAVIYSIEHLMFAICTAAIPGPDVIPWPT